jgi:Protein of unknown function (DUF1592)/Protein of unknown function (DUF1588)/Protein of unknown function (DUF1587)/Protein of unknown function (DUF1595)/Protein of unknown function (DUF1585)
LGDFSSPVPVAALLSTCVRVNAVAPRTTALAGLLLAAGCYRGAQGHGGDDAASAGTAGEGADAAGSEGASEGGSDTDAPGSDCAELGAGLAPMRRLTRVQYANTVRDLFDDAITASESFPSSQIFEDYTNNPNANIVSLASAEDILLAAEETALQVIDEVETVVGCAPLDDTCAEAYVLELATRGFRRPLRDDEHGQLLALYHDVADVDGPAEGIGTVVMAVLQSPQLLYLVEEGAEEIEPGVLRLTDHEIATRLSYLVWDTMPDDELRAAADAGELQTPEQITAQVERLLADRTRSGPALERFVREWVHFDGAPTYDKDLELFPQYDDTLVAAMDGELSRFIQGVLWSDTPTLERMLLASETEVDATMAAFFGVEAPSDGWAAVTLDPAQRPGLLARPALLAEHSLANATAPIFRGKLVRTRLLCQPIPPPPADAMANVPDYPDDATERERTQILIEHENCGGCHSLMNPIGLGFEQYDPIGAWRELDIDGAPVDASGVIIDGPADASGEFVGVRALGELLAASETVDACFARELYRFSLGLGEGQALECAASPVQAAFVDGDGDIIELVTTLASSEAFRYRVLEE